MATADHVIPRAAGGTSALANLVLSCRHHNSRRGDIPYAVYRRRCGLSPDPDVEERAKKWRASRKTGDEDNRRTLGVWTS
jgi:5-methylcytosine-specific restriction endonuclease McrA